MRGYTILVLLALAFSHGISAGEIYKCVAANGGVTYTNIACPADSQSEHVSSYEREPVVRSAQVDAEAARAAEISARLAQQAAAAAQNAAYEAEQAAYREPAEWESDHSNYNASDNQLWYPTYPYYGAGLPWRVGGGGNHRPGGGHDGGHRPGHGGGKPGAPKPTPLPSKSAQVRVRH
ncbi:MAG TPA: DUF4124 domain-containing protein [Rudaea sp.]|nr:DUF4124 domain-containing protein [Rudaea sp.]